ncbi:UNVERIFIED_CONTAM: hypothetical protein Sradi_2385900 [Sesamum radiatum]|uniref:Uncharacterized protein n=1 Tax=Sesamum radiatum TaxID=300843 RepID=A0AAW2T9X4_SESRA
MTRLEGAKGSWVEELLGILWAYRTTPKIAIRGTPLCFVDGSEVVIPAEIGEETARISRCDSESNHQERNFDLATIEEKRDRTFAKVLHYKAS